MTWRKFWSLKEILKSKLPTKLKKKVMDGCLLPCLSYGSQTWILNKNATDKIQKTQRAMERSILNIRLKDKVKTCKIREKTGVIDALQHMRKLKWKWAGHVARLSDERWTYLTTIWAGPSGKRARSHPKQCWVDKIEKHAGNHWVNKAK